MPATSSATRTATNVVLFEISRFRSVLQGILVDVHILRRTEMEVVVKPKVRPPTSLPVRRGIAREEASSCDRMDSRIVPPVSPRFRSS